MQMTLTAFLFVSFLTQVKQAITCHHFVLNISDYWALPVAPRARVSVVATNVSIAKFHKNAKFH